ncbi:hypothetical protein A3A21_02785 [Candidatus Jorgensenbacteria bacterium RIFCSPLOWO2_01_FULL_45_25b]|uniref:TNase-like domain-containing protein n=1 Tax=Candidatus Jorgensenbacteria bacterium RIFCSPLOWO2_01_FULL_45_25b TaxID=1798471 RepID=A0A1F6C000_9BACT|nr:MAG: hypothetical protein A3A21_02785 [Candidatus Jorgensenbacteria bacterium RIFCSPLOWO2_01_FULL_45_25b]
MKNIGKPILFIVLAFGAGFFMGNQIPGSGERLVASLVQLGKEEKKQEVEIREEKKSETFIVTNVIDGDTIQIEGGELVQYIGIDAPEGKSGDSEVCFASGAKVRNQILLAGKKVRLERDVSDRDGKGRLLRYVYAEDPEGKEGEIFINLALVKDGAAFTVSYPPDVKYQKSFEAEEEKARERRVGLWATCDETLEVLLPGK